MLTVNIYKMPANLLELGRRYGAVIELYKPLTRCGKPPPYYNIAVVIRHNADIRQRRGGRVIKLAENGGYLGGIAPRAYKFPRSALAEHRVYRINHYGFPRARFTRQDIKAR